jgi:hypothetical protein
MPTDSDARLVLSLDSDYDTLVVGEPFKMTVVLTNRSNKTAYFIGFDNFRLAISYEVVPPGGKKERRYSSRYKLADGWHVRVDPKGEPLYHGDNVVASCYPNISWTRRRRSGPPTFIYPGNYKIRGVYHVENSRESPLYSNWITIVLVSPTAQQKEIFDAYWCGVSDIIPGHIFGLSGARKGGPEESAIRAIVEKYPNDNYVPYAYYALLGMLACPFRFDVTGSLDEVVAIGDILRSKYPDFNYVEVRFLVACCFRRYNKNAEALKLYKECYLRDPRISQDYYFIYSVIDARGDYNGRWHWLRKRRLGIVKGITLADF